MHTVHVAESDYTRYALHAGSPEKIPQHHVASYLAAAAEIKADAVGGRRSSFASLSPRGKVTLRRLSLATGEEYFVELSLKVSCE